MKMNILRRELAPISPEGWGLIDAAAKEALQAKLSARKFVDIDGPHGFAHAAVGLGRLTVVAETGPKTLGYGIHQVLPLVETRIPFALPIWELDNLARGAKDVDLSPVLDASAAAADFEESAVFAGLEPAGIVGVQQAAKDSLLTMPLEPDAVIDAVSAAQTKLLKAGIVGAAHLVVSEAVGKYLARVTASGTLRAIVEKQIGASVIVSAFVTGALLVAARGGDLVLTLGQDFAVGYQGRDDTTVGLYLTESFTFRVVTPAAVVGFSLG
jgi:uncharacterized linocin/CFP29 family protein